MKQSDVLKEMIEWVKNRIKELPGEQSIYYKDMQESLEWELKTVLERETE